MQQNQVTEGTFHGIINVQEGSTGPNVLPAIEAIEETSETFDKVSKKLKPFLDMFPKQKGDPEIIYTSGG